MGSSREDLMKIEINKDKSTSQLQETIWSKVKIKLQEVYGEEEYSNWLKLLSLHSVRNNIVIFNAATKFMCDWINSHYGKKILSLWREFDKLITDISIVVYENKISTETTTNKELQKDNSELNKNTKSDLYNNLDPRFTFKNFILHFHFNFIIIHFVKNYLLITHAYFLDYLNFLIFKIENIH